MNIVVNRFTAAPDTLPLKEVSRYMGIRWDGLDCEIERKIQQLLPRFLKELNCRACWTELPLLVSADKIDMELFCMDSAKLSDNLRDCNRAIIFAATIGNGIDRLCRAASFSAPSNALIYDALGSAAIEWFCDALCSELSNLYPTERLCPRFSPGYGDLSLEYQNDILRVLDAQRRIGLTLSESLMMIPQKSVTAIIGMKAKNDKEVEV